MTTDPETGPAAGIGAEPRRTPSGRDVVRRIVRITLVALWVVWAGCAWWSAPREAEANQLLKDASAGRITSVERYNTWTYHGWQGWGLPSQPSDSSGGAQIAWSTTSGQVRRTGPSLGNFEVSDVPGNDAGQYDLVGGLQRAAAKGIADPARVGSLDQGPWARTAAIASRALATVYLVMVIFGPTPRRGNRWYWFWLSMAPLGLGVLLWLWREHPWAPGTPAADGTADEETADDIAGSNRRRGDGRDSGFTGFVVMFASRFVVALAIWGAGSLLGPSIVPG